MIADSKGAKGLREIDLGAGHSSASASLSARVVAASKAEGLLNESVGAGYVERNWPPALKESGAWPLASLRQALLNGSLTRLIDPDAVLRGKIPEFVARGDFGFASGQEPDGTYKRVWHREMLPADEVTFEADVFLLAKAKAQALKTGRPTPAPAPPPPGPAPTPEPTPGPTPVPGTATRTFVLKGNVPPELWNRLGTKILPKLRSGNELQIGIDFSVTVESDVAKTFEADIRQILEDLGLTGKVRME